MRGHGLTAALFLVSIVAGSTGAAADLGKLDPRARIAAERLQAGAGLGSDQGAVAVSEDGMLDVFLHASASRAELEAKGARVRSELPGGLFTAYVPLAALAEVAALPSVTAIRGAAPVEIELDTSVPATGASALRGAGPSFGGLNGAGVLLGNVDTGADFDHGDFENAAGGTRFVRIWDQAGVDSPPPVPFGYGAEWTPAQIDAGLCTQIDDNGHGTHVLGIAAGDGSQTGGANAAHTYAGMAPRADLVMVKSNFTNSGILDGVKYVFDLATARGQSAVVNLSIGSHFGPHDGSSDLESGITTLTGPGRIVVKSAGNDRGSARHAEVKAAGTGTNVTMSVGGSALGRTFQIDGYYDATENVSVRIRTPSGTTIGPITRGNRNATFPGSSTTNGNVYVENGISRTRNGDYEVYVEIAAATSSHNMNGTWTFTFIPVALGAAQGEVDLWRFFSSPGVTANFVTGNQPGEELISEPGNASGVITTAAYVTKRDWIDCNGQPVNFSTTPVGSIAWFSSPGPTRDGREKPDIAAPGAAIVSTTSFDLTRTCTTASPLVNDAMNHLAMAGTSMAAPHTTGAVALLLQAFGSTMTPTTVRNYLSVNAVRDASTGTTWNRDWGNGKLRLLASLLPAPDPIAAPRLAIDAVAPNPARGAVVVAFSVPRAERVHVGITDVQGRTVATLADRVFHAGPHEVRWNGAGAGAAVRPGLYFAVARTAGERASRRLIVTR